MCGAGHEAALARAAQIEHELALIAELRYEAYFLTVWDIVRFARERGSCARAWFGGQLGGVLCAVASRYHRGRSGAHESAVRTLHLPRAQRAAGHRRRLEHQRREEVIQYLYTKYGRERAALAATVITYRTRSALRDVGKALGLGLEQVEALVAAVAAWRRHAQIQPEHPGRGRFRCAQPGAQTSAGAGQYAAWFSRHLSQHVGGFVIAASRLDELVPIENASMPQRTVIQWERTTSRHWACSQGGCAGAGDAVGDPAGDRSGERADRTGTQALTLAGIPAEDPAVYRMIQQADTVGVFQIESRAQMSMLPRLKPACFYDLVIEVAIVRQGRSRATWCTPICVGDRARRRWTIRRRRCVRCSNAPSACRSSRSR